MQGAQYEDLRRKAARDLSQMNVAGRSFDGFGIGGALDKQSLGEILRWVNEELPKDKIVQDIKNFVGQRFILYMKRTVKQGTGNWKK